MIDGAGVNAPNHSIICGSLALVACASAFIAEFCNSPAIDWTLVGVAPACTSRCSAQSLMSRVHEPDASAAIRTWCPAAMRDKAG